MTSTQNDSAAPYSDLSGQTKGAPTSEFLPVSEPKYPQLGESSQQPTYVVTQKQVVVQQPEVDRHSAISSRLKSKNCCGIFSYPMGVKVMAVLQILSWISWGISFVIDHMWWFWLFAVLAIIMCYYGYTGANHYNERHLRFYLYYLVCMMVIDVVMMIVFGTIGHAVGIIGWFFVLMITMYWCHVVRDFVRIIHKVDYGSRSFLEEYKYQNPHDEEDHN